MPVNSAQRLRLFYTSFLILLAIAFYPGIGQARAQEMLYDVKPKLGPNGAITALVITLSLDADADGITEFDLPRRWADSDNLWQYIQNIDVTGGEHAMAPDDPARLIIHSQPHASLKIAYEIHSAIAGLPDFTASHPFKPWITPDWFYIAGETAFIIPLERDDLSIQFQWSGPKTIEFASDLQHHDGHIADLDSVSASTLIGGRDLRITTKGALRLATLGHYSFSDEALLDQAGPIIAAQRAFWGEDVDQPYLITNAPLAADDFTTAFTGTGKGDGFALSMTQNVTVEDVRWLLAHEAFHSWNPIKLGGFVGGGRENPLAAFWFSEGFTDYYARHLLLQAGLFTPSDFAASWNDLLQVYANLFQDLKAHGDSHDLHRLPYLQGAVLAVRWNKALQDISKGRVNLDDILKLQYAIAPDSQDPNAAVLFERIAGLFGLDIQDDLRRHIDERSEIALAADSFGPCYIVTTTDRPVFDYGFDTTATRNAQMVLKGVREGGPAYKAGLRNGMTLLEKKAGKSGYSDQDYVWQVRDLDGQVKTVSYLPAGNETYRVQSLSPRAGCGA